MQSVNASSTRDKSNDRPFSVQVCETPNQNAKLDAFRVVMAPTRYVAGVLAVTSKITANQSGQHEVLVVDPNAPRHPNGMPIVAHRITLIVEAD